MGGGGVGGQGQVERLAVVGMAQVQPSSSHPCSWNSPFLFEPLPLSFHPSLGLEDGGPLLGFL